MAAPDRDQLDKQQLIRQLTQGTLDENNLILLQQLIRKYTPVKPPSLEEELYKCWKCGDEWEFQDGLTCKKTSPLYPLYDGFPPSIEFAHDKNEWERANPGISEINNQSVGEGQYLALSKKFKVHQQPKSEAHFICYDCFGNCIEKQLKCSDGKAYFCNPDRYTFRCVTSGMCGVTSDSEQPSTGCKSNYYSVLLDSYLTKALRLDLIVEKNKLLTICQGISGIPLLANTLVLSDEKQDKDEKEELHSLDDCTLVRTLDYIIQVALPELFFYYCPACNAKVGDWTGCASIACSNCKNEFCMFCLEVYCGEDNRSALIHEHVRQCRLNTHTGRDAYWIDGLKLSVPDPTMPDFAVGDHTFPGCVIGLRQSEFQRSFDAFLSSLNPTQKRQLVSILRKDVKMTLSSIELIPLEREVIYSKRDMRIILTHMPKEQIEWADVNPLRIMDIRFDGLLQDSGSPKNWLDFIQLLVDVRYNKKIELLWQEYKSFPTRFEHPEFKQPVEQMNDIIKRCLPPRNVSLIGRDFRIRLEEERQRREILLNRKLAQVRLDTLNPSIIEINIRKERIRHLTEGQANRTTRINNVIGRGLRPENYVETIIDLEENRQLALLIEEDENDVVGKELLRRHLLLDSFLKDKISKSDSTLSESDKVSIIFKETIKYLRHSKEQREKEKDELKNVFLQLDQEDDKRLFMLESELIESEERKRRKLEYISQQTSQEAQDVLTAKDSRNRRKISEASAALSIAKMIVELEYLRKDKKEREARLRQLQMDRINPLVQPTPMSYLDYIENKRLQELEKRFSKGDSDSDDEVQALQRAQSDDEKEGRKSKTKRTKQKSLKAKAKTKRLKHKKSKRSKRSKAKKSKAKK